MSWARYIVHVKRNRWEVWERLPDGRTYILSSHQTLAEARRATDASA